MARNLLAAGHPLTVWNRSKSKADSLAAQGAIVTNSAAEAVSGARTIITMLANGPVVDSVLFGAEGAAPSIAAGALVIDMSSAPPDLARATLVGPVGSGQLAKLANQAIVAVTIGAVAEALLLAAAGGADPAAVRQAILGGFADSRVLALHGNRMIIRDFIPGGPADHQLKDCTTIVATAKAAGLTLPFAETALALFRDLVAHGGARYDHSALVLELERRNAPARLGTAPDRLPAA